MIQSLLDLLDKERAGRDVSIIDARKITRNRQRGRTFSLTKLELERGFRRALPLLAFLTIDSTQVLSFAYLAYPNTH